MNTVFAVIIEEYPDGGWSDGLYCDGYIVQGFVDERDWLGAYIRPLDGKRFFVERDYIFETLEEAQTKLADMWKWVVRGRATYHAQGLQALLKQTLNCLDRVEFAELYETGMELINKIEEEPK